MLWTCTRLRFRSALAVVGLVCYPALSAGQQLAFLPTNPEMPYLGFESYNDQLFSLTYERATTGGRLNVEYRMRYVDFIRQSKPIVSLGRPGTPMSFHMPALNLRLANTTQRTALFTTTKFDVRQSETDNTPIPLLFSDVHKERWLEILNEGWGAMLNTEVVVFVTSEEECQRAAGPVNDSSTAAGRGQAIRVPGQMVEIRLGSIADSREFTVPATLIPPSLVGHDSACAAGWLRYSTPTNVQVSLPFLAAIQLKPPPRSAAVAPPVPPSDVYLLRLNAGVYGYVAEVVISQQVPPNGVDSFLIEVESDMSASFLLDARAEATDGRSLALGTIALKYFRPRTHPLRSRTLSDYKSIPSHVYGPITGYIERVAENQSWREIAIYPSLSWHLLKPAEQLKVHHDLEELLIKYIRDAKSSYGRFVRRLDYCYIGLSDTCVRSGALRLPQK